MTEIPQQPLTVALLYVAPPRPDLERLERDLAHRFGTARLASGGEASSAIFELPELPYGEFDKGKVPCTVSFLWFEHEAGEPDLDASLEQTWDWPEAHAAVQGVTSSLLVAPMISWAWLDRQSRLQLAHGATEAVLEQTQPVALHWITCQRLVQPAAYRRTRTELTDRLYPASNVRMFRVSDSEPGEILMDTLGMAALGLPDLEVRYTQLNPSAVAAQLFNLALYLFESGDVIADGHTVDGVPAGAPWRARRSVASVEPARTVLALTPI